MKTLLSLAATLEMLTGLALIIAPSGVAWLLLGDGASGTGIELGRVGGFGLLALGLACYRRSYDIDSFNQAALGMLIYNMLVAVYLIYLGISGEWVGKLLWPAAVLHAVLTLLLTYAWKGKFLTVLKPKADN